MSSCTLMDGVGPGDVILLPVILLPAIVIVKLVWLPGIIVWADADKLLEFIPASTLTTNTTATIVTARVEICFIVHNTKYQFKDC
jgi:low affinity Fe/Cu permease